MSQSHEDQQHGQPGAESLRRPAMNIEGEA
ncbi:MAG: hypothetical protein OJF50_004247 [Nitrospira sp.]|jgi:hypothetical protein|nr:hypothetical protein [Nitrospira sp.]